MIHFLHPDKEVANYRTSMKLNRGEWIKKLSLSLVFFLAACGSLPVSAEPTLIVNQYPTPLPTPTLAVNTKPIGQAETDEALNFFYELKNRGALRQYEHFSEEIRYPITVQVDGGSKTFIYAAEFEANFEKIFSAQAIQKFITTDETELSFTSNGVKVADGIMWFDLICMDPDCEEAEFLITEINNK
jgi:hypothetical protein